MQRDFHKTAEPQVNIIPMIDIMLFLLVFFMLSTMYMVQANTIQINLPAAAAANRETRPDIVHLTVNQEGYVFFDTEEQPAVNLAASVQQQLNKNPETVFVLRGDRKAEYNDVVKVLDLLKKTGVRHVSIATELRGGR